VEFDGGLREGETVEGNLLFGVVRIRARSGRLGHGGDGHRVDEGREGGGVEDRGLAVCFGFG